MSATSIEIRALAAQDRAQALAVINTAARWYREFLPPEDLHEPEMTPEDWDREAARMTWYGAFDAGALLGVMALERIAGPPPVALLRHAYILDAAQRHGLGTLLCRHLEDAAGDVARIVVGTYAANHKARGALTRLGYTPSADSEAVLRTYYDIPENRLKSSVTYEKQLVPDLPG